MLHVFEPFRPAHLSRLLEMKRFYLVSQQYRRYQSGLQDAVSKPSLLLTDYENAAMAHTHAHALVSDPYAAVIDLQKPAHRRRLEQLLGPDNRFHLFWAVVRSADEVARQVNRLYRGHMKRYIETHTSWRINAEATLRPQLHVLFGELFITLRYRQQVLRVKFEEIETA